MEKKYISPLRKTNQRNFPYLSANIRFLRKMNCFYK